MTAISLHEDYDLIAKFLFTEKTTITIAIISLLRRRRLVAKHIFHHKKIRLIAKKVVVTKKTTTIATAVILAKKTTECNNVCCFYD